MTRGGASAKTSDGNIISDCMRTARADLLMCPFMNTLIENAESLEYLTSKNQWSKNADDGKCFGHTGAAFDAAKMEPIGRFNIVGYICQTGQLVNLNHGRGKGIAETTPA